MELLSARLPYRAYTFTIAKGEQEVCAFAFSLSCSVDQDVSALSCRHYA